MILGVTGTQNGMTAQQRKKALWWFAAGEWSELHHGDCIGVDEQMDEIAESNGLRRVIHPPVNTSKRAFCCGELILPERGYLDRNEDIVDASDVMLGVPKTMTEELRSGTWATIRYARKMRRKTIILWPDGSEKRLFVQQGLFA